MSVRTESCRNRTVNTDLHGQPGVLHSGVDQSCNATKGNAPVGPPLATGCHSPAVPARTALIVPNRSLLYLPLACLCCLTPPPSSIPQMCVSFTPEPRSPELSPFDEQVNTGPKGDSWATAKLQPCRWESSQCQHARTLRS